MKPFVIIGIILATSVAAPVAGQPVPVRAIERPRPNIPLDPLADFVFPLIYDGGGYLSSIFLTSRDSSMLHLGVFFSGTDGYPVALPVQGLGMTTGVYLDLDVNQSVTLQTTGQSSRLVDAYAMVFTFDRPASDPSAKLVTGLFSGMASFSKNVNGILVEANEPVSSGFETTAAMPFDNTAGHATGIVLVNPDPVFATNVTLTIRDNMGGLLAKDVISIPAGAKAGVNLPAAYQATVGQTGRVFLSGDGSFLASIGLRVNSTGAFSTLLPFSLDSRLMQ